MPHRRDETDETDEPTGRGTPMGTPSHDLDEAPPSADQEENEVVSGGGVVGDEEEPLDKARPTSD